jgi:hypothetical protein
MYGSNSSHTDRQYWAVDSITASSTACSRNQIDSRRNSLGMVANRRRSGFCSGVLASRTTTDNDHQHFLVYVNAWYLVGHRFLLTWKRQNAREKGYTPSRATTLPARMGGATQIGSKRTFQIKLIDGLTSSRVQTTFAVHA